MLEEGLRKTTFPPGDAALAMLSFIRFELPEGGTSAEERFLRLFSLLNDRVFGPIAGAKEHFHHEIGGWLSFQNRWERPGRSRSVSNGPSMNSRGTHALSMDSDPVVQLLCGVEALVAKDKLPTLLEAVSSETYYRPNVHFQFPFQALPLPSQELVLAILQSTIDGKPVDTTGRSNGEKLFQNLLRVHPKDQHELRRYLASKTQIPQDGNRPLSLSPLSRMTSPFHNISNFSLPRDKEEQFKTPHIMLTMLEVYLMTFIRYALASPKSSSPQPQGMTSNRPVSRSIPYGEQVYLHLFKCYLLHFLPNSEVCKDFLGYTPLNRNSELFLRIVLELWLCGETKFTAVVKAADTFRERRRSERSPDLSTYFDLIYFNYNPPLPHVQTCIRSLIIHVLKDPHTALSVKDCYDFSQRATTAENTTGPAMLPWCVSPSMTVLQQPFFNFIISTFRHAPIHVLASPFFTALDTWLMWLEPWNMELRRKNTANISDFSAIKAGNLLANTVANITHSHQPAQYSPVLILPKSKSSSRFTKQWEVHIAANLHFYTAPLAIFLRRVRELDFSARDFTRSFGIVQRVFRVYSPTVVNVINALLAGGGTHDLSSLVAKHNQYLAEFSPAMLGQLSLSSLGQDMHNLLEEISSQYVKKILERDFFDRMEARIENLLASVGLAHAAAGEERDIQLLVEKAKIIAGLPPEYEIIPDSKARSLISGNNGERAQLERDQRGVLTERGRSQLITGEVTCRPVDIYNFGDRMRSGPQSHEIAMFVPFTIYASDWLNGKLGLDLPQKMSTMGKSINDPQESVLEALLLEDEASRKIWYRVNLRFLADYRNCIFICVVLWSWNKYCG